MRTDYTADILSEHGPHAVLSEHQPITWPGGSTIGLHRVLHHGHPAMFLRACAHDALHWLVFDLRDVAPPAFEQEHQALPALDSAGLVLYTLRGQHANAAAFLTQVLKCCKGAWRDAELGLRAQERAA